MHAEEAWAGVHDDAICGTCRYRSICPDSAAPDTPSWPSASDATAVEDDVLAAAAAVDA